MLLKQLRTDSRAVSPVIGVILMVAITVILAAVIGTFVLGLGEGLSTSPTAQIGTSVDSNAVEFAHNGGENIDGANLQIVSSASAVSVDSPNPSGEYATGSVVSSTLSNSGTSDVDTTISLVWDNGDSSATLATLDVTVADDGSVS